MIAIPVSTDQRFYTIKMSVQSASNILADKNPPPVELFLLVKSCQGISESKKLVLNFNTEFVI